MEGAREQELGILVTFEQHPEQVINNARLFEWDLSELIDQKLLEIIHVSPVELDVDYHIYEIQKLVQKKRAKRLVFDSISSFEIGMSDKYKYTDYLWGMTDFFKTQGVSVLLINETPGLFDIQSLSKHGVSYIADNIIILQLVQDNFKLRRLLGVLKVRGALCSGEIKELVLGPQGPEIGTTDRNSSNSDPAAPQDAGTKKDRSNREYD